MSNEKTRESDKLHSKNRFQARYGARERLHASKSWSDSIAFIKISFLSLSTFFFGNAVKSGINDFLCSGGIESVVHNFLHISLSAGLYQLRRGVGRYANKPYSRARKIGPTSCRHMMSFHNFWVVKSFSLGRHVSLVQHANQLHNSHYGTTISTQTLQKRSTCSVWCSVGN